MSQYHAKLTRGRLLGAGHFGAVYEATDPIHGKVAVKVLRQKPKEVLDDWEHRKRDLIDEGKHLAAAEHRNVVRVYQLIESPNSDEILLTMAYCPGGSLETKYYDRPMNIRMVRDIASGVASGLDALHSRGLLHRDIKPANILLGEDNEIKIGDFGLVTDRLIYGYASDQGYLDHLAKEVHEGNGTSIKTDIWALGMTLYRLLHGHKWYEENDRPADVILNGNFAKNLSWLPHIPQAWRKIIRKTMHDDPQHRFQSCGQFLEALALLPINPAWDCEVSPDSIIWSHSGPKRIITVEWQRLSPRRHSWQAVSNPIGTGRHRRLGGATSVTLSQVRRELEAFFSSPPASAMSR